MPTDSVEVLTPSGWMTFKPSLPTPLHSHCMKLISPTEVIIIGGFLPNWVAVANTLIITNYKRIWVPGPSLNAARAEFGCAHINVDQYNNEKSIIAVSGYSVPGWFPLLKFVTKSLQLIIGKRFLDPEVSAQERILYFCY